MEKWQAWEKITFASGVDPGFTEEIASIPGGEQVLRCIQCGTCSGMCPLSPYMDYMPRQIIAMIRAGLRGEVLSGINISAKVDVAQVVAFAAKLPFVSVAREYKFMCSDPGQELIQSDFRAGLIDRVVVASCSPLMHEATFRNALAGAQGNPYLFQMANIREHISWVTEDKASATVKAQAVIAAAIQRVALHTPLQRQKVAVHPDVLIVGGGIAGIHAALTLAEADKKVFLVEREPTIGVGTVIIATGYSAFNPSGLYKYGYGRYPDVYTSLEVERLLNASGPTGGEVLLKDGRKPGVVGIIHCVGSRDAHANRYCSKVCCMYSLKLAHLIKERTGADIYNFYIDMRTPGKGYEEFYDRLLEERVHFIRGRVAQITDWPLHPEESGKLVIRAEDTLVGSIRRIPVDMVVLSVGLEPARDADTIRRLFNINCGSDGWFLERHPKLAPVSTATEGIFLAGACQGPKDIPESVAQAGAAAAEAVSLIDLEWIAASEGDKVQRVCNEMTAALRCLGPSKVREPTRVAKEQPAPLLIAS